MLLAGAVCTGTSLPHAAAAQSSAPVVYAHPVGFSPAARKESTGSSDAEARAIGSANRIQHGVIGAVSGALVGGAAGYAYVAMHCESGVPCSHARAVLTGAAVGAVLGVIIEYVIRSWPHGPVYYPR
jgi:hypothetical protein